MVPVSTHKLANIIVNIYSFAIMYNHIVMSILRFGLLDNDSSSTDSFGTSLLLLNI